MNLFTLYNAPPPDVACGFYSVEPAYAQKSRAKSQAVASSVTVMLPHAS